MPATINANFETHADNGRLSIKAKPNQSFMESELGEFLCRRPHAYSTWQHLVPKEWSAEDIDGYCRELLAALEGARRGESLAAMLVCTRENGVAHRPFCMVLPKTAFDRKDKSRVLEFLSSRLPDTGVWTVWIWTVSGGTSSDKRGDVENVRRMLHKRFGGASAPRPAAKSQEPKKGEPPARAVAPPPQPVEESPPAPRPVELVGFCEYEGELPLLLEGGRIYFSGTRLERQRTARTHCLRHHGTACLVCGIEFGTAYGRGEGFIHVHHIEPLAAAEGPRPVDPYRDLVPVCPNCHAMLHTQEPPLSVEELKKELQARGWKWTKA